MTSRQTPMDGAQAPEKVARRRFLRTAVVGGVSIVAALPVAASALPGNAPVARAGSARDAADGAVLDVLRRYGSELGGVTRVR
ncbi:MAG: hypothetical protein AB7P31_04240 [Steroidobacteraceae bacterium]